MINQPTNLKRSRPALAQDYGVNPSQTDRMLSWQWLTDRMVAAHNYWVGSTRPDGRPHAMPVWGVWMDETFYFSTGRHSRKGRNLATNPAVVVHLESGDETVIIEGIVEEFSDAPLFAHFAEVYDLKYPGYKPELVPANVYYRLKPQVAFAWLESDYVASATRWHFDY